MKSYLIHFIRHGFTKANLEGKYNGQKNVPLSIEGMSQILDMKKAYEYPQATTFISAPHSRCVDTLKIIYPDKKAVIIDDFMEYDFGAFEGKTAKDLEGDTDFEAWVSGGKDMAPPFGETNEHFASRVCGTFVKVVEGLMKTGSTSTVICAPSGVFMTILSAFGLPQLPMYEWMTGNGAGYTIRITPSIWMRGQKFEVEGILPYGYGEIDQDPQLELVEQGKEEMRKNKPDEYESDETF